MDLDPTHRKGLPLSEGGELIAQCNGIAPPPDNGTLRLGWCRETAAHSILLHIVAIVPFDRGRVQLSKCCGEA